MPGGCVLRIHGASFEEFFQVVQIVQNAGAELGIARPLVLATPDFKGILFEAVVIGGFLRAELSNLCHVVSSFPGYARAGCVRAGFERKIRSLKNNKIPGSDAGKRKNLRVLCKPGDYYEYVIFSVYYEIHAFCCEAKKVITGLSVF